MDHTNTSCSPSCSAPLQDVEGQSLSPAARAKVDRICKACQDGPDIEALLQLAISEHGLVYDEARRKAWPILLGYRLTGESPLGYNADWHDLPRHKDEDQVRLDVDRSFIYYPKSWYYSIRQDRLYRLVDVTVDETDRQLDRRKEELSSVITQVLRSHPMLSYFQGFHDIVQVFLLVLGADEAPAAVSHLSLLRIRDFMLPSLSASLAHLRLLPSILHAADPNLCHHLSQTQPFFALAATICLYAHDIEEYGDIARLFDFLLAHSAVVSLYFFAVIVLSRREELFDIPADEPEMLHSVLSKLPKPLDLEALISETTSLYAKFPPESLPFRAWAKISPFSVLKTTRGSFRQQTLNDGVELFEKQVAQLHREQMLEQVRATFWKYRRPTRRVGLAIFIGVMAFWLRRNGFETFAGSAFQQLWGYFRIIGRQ
ncbi:MAG: hypothetical protein LQ345_002289 [Seirophora villosa]|nr:MAG: hypothetical protein LQ345_002289 [Seirophora villosa]